MSTKLLEEKIVEKPTCEEICGLDREKEEKEEALRRKKQAADAEFDTQYQSFLDGVERDMEREFAKGEAGMPIDCQVGFDVSEKTVEDFLAMLPGTCFHRFLEKVRSDPRNIVFTKGNGLRITRAEIENRLEREAAIEGKAHYDTMMAHVNSGLKVNMVVQGCGVWPTMDKIKRCVRYLKELIRLCEQDPNLICEPYSHGLLIGRLEIVNKELNQRYRSTRGNHFIHLLQQQQPAADGASTDISSILGKSVLSTPSITHVSMSTLPASKLDFLRVSQQRLDEGMQIRAVSSPMPNPDVEAHLDADAGGNGDVYRVLRSDADNQITYTTHGFYLTSKKAAAAINERAERDRIAAARASIFGNLFSN